MLTLPLSAVPESAWRVIPYVGAGRRRRLSLLAGEELVTFYESTPGTHRGFCKVCGAPVLVKFDEHSRSAQTDSSAVALYGVALATLDDDPGVHPDAHAFIIDKAPWFTITDGLRVHCEDGDRSREWRGLHDICLPGREFIVQVSVTATNIGAVISGLQSLPSVFRN